MASTIFASDKIFNTNLVIKDIVRFFEICFVSELWVSEFRPIFQVVFLLKTRPYFYVTPVSTPIRMEIIA